mgnify:CR=1 FL=1
MRTFILLAFVAMVCPQTLSDDSVETLDDPDEGYFLDQLMTALFQRIDIVSADSISLHNRGYSPLAVQQILMWQGQDDPKKTVRKLKRMLSQEDKHLLNQDDPTRRDATQMVLRQRIQYSPSLEGYRLLNKARVWNQWGTITLLAEQDPGEVKITDHAILTATTPHFPGFTQLMLGDFHISWGGGLLLNQQGYRSSLNPAKLFKQSQMILRPHYSTRERDYYRGLAGTFSLNQINGSVFLSQRKALGKYQSGTFREDADGIHPRGQSFDSKNFRAAGMALQADFSHLQCYASTLLSADQNPGLGHELGVLWEMNSALSLQVYTDHLMNHQGRASAIWVYKSHPLNFSIRFNHYAAGAPDLSGAVPALLGSSASNENDIMVRSLLRPTQSLRIAYALDLSRADQLGSFEDLRTLQQHKLQVQWKPMQSVWQFDWSQKEELNIMPHDIWRGNTYDVKVLKSAGALQQKISSHLEYRLNLKLASSNKIVAHLFQQRILLKFANWQGAFGFVRYEIPEYALRLSVYESSVKESFSFFTAFDDGQRWFLHFRGLTNEFAEFEFKLAQSRSYEVDAPAEQLEYSLQMSIVL